MKEVAKAIIIDEKGHYLLLYLNNHPRFHNDPDLPGGIVDDNEEPLTAVIREVYEETEIVLRPSHVRLLTTDSTYSNNSTVYYVYLCQVTKRPTVKTSWEHTSYRWLSKQQFLQSVRPAADTYMHLVYLTALQLK